MVGSCAPFRKVGAVGMSKAPAMPLFVDAFMADTMHLTEAEVGVYMRLLMCMWRNEGKLPNNDDRLARFAQVSKAKWVKKFRPVLEVFFDVSDDFLTQKRLKKEWEYVQEKTEKNRTSGKRGGEAKAQKNKETGLANATETLDENPSECSSETPSENVPTHTHTHKEDNEYKYSSSSDDGEIKLGKSEFAYLLDGSGLSPSDLNVQIGALVERYGAGQFQNAFETARVSAKRSPLKYIITTLQNSKTWMPSGSPQPSDEPSLNAWERLGMTKEEYDAV